jgi:hypothetical protein
MSVRIALYVGESLLLAIGMFYLGFKVIPGAARNLRRTKWGGILFFTAAGAVNVDVAINALVNRHARHYLANWHAIGIRVIAIAGLYTLVTGLYLEYVKWGPWSRRSAQEDDEIRAEIARRWPGPERRVGRDPGYQGPERRVHPEQMPVD